MLCLLFPEEQKYIDELCEVIWAICGEQSWVIAPHLNNCEPDEYRTHTDLFACETGYMLAEVMYLLGDRLPSKIKILMRSEVTSRIFDAFETRTYWWEGLYSNWAAVCGGSVGMTYMLMAPERFCGVKSRIMHCIDNYLEGFGEDGCTTEGIGYWYYGFWFFINFADILYRFTDGKEDIRHSKKIDNIALYHQNMILRGNTVVSFSDGSREYDFNSIGLYGYLKENYEGFLMPGNDMLVDSDPNNAIERRRFSWLLRNFLRSNPDLSVDMMWQSGYKYYENAQWYIVKNEKYSLAAKAGHNEEEHNHNDVGHFIIATDGGQMLCDIGAMEYTIPFHDPKTRYQREFSSSSYMHSVPIIDDNGQQFGKSFAAKNVCADENAFEMQIQGAYETDIDKITRTIKPRHDRVVLTDSYGRNFEKHQVTERFVSVVEPEIANAGVKVGDVLIKTDVIPKISKRIISDKSCRPLNVYLIDYMLTNDSFTAEFVVI